VGEPLGRRPLGPRWRLERDDPHGFALRASTEGEGRRVVGLALVGLASAASAWGLVAATLPALELVTWPPAALLALVAVLSVPAALRAARRWRRGVGLVLEGETLSGTPADGGLLGAAALAVPAGAVTRVVLRRRDDGALQLWSLEVLLGSGRRLEGPLLAVPAGEDSPLLPVAERLAERLGCPLEAP
jgi:hypothetical protein